MLLMMTVVTVFTVNMPFVKATYWVLSCCNYPTLVVIVTSPCCLLLHCLSDFTTDLYDGWLPVFLTLIDVFVLSHVTKLLNRAFRLLTEDWSSGDPWFAVQYIMAFRTTSTMGIIGPGMRSKRKLGGTAQTKQMISGVLAVRRWANPWILPANLL